MNFIKTRIEAIGAEGITVTLGGDARLTLPVDSSQLTTGDAQGLPERHLIVPAGIDDNHVDHFVSFDPGRQFGDARRRMIELPVSPDVTVEHIKASLG